MAEHTFNLRLRIKQINREESKMHVVTILRYYLGLTQSELAARSSVGYVDVNEIEYKPDNGLIE